MLETDAGRVAQAVAMAREVQKQRPKEPIGYVLEGDVHAQKKSWSEAAAAYRTGLKQVGTVDLAIKLHGALVAAGNAAEADGWRRHGSRSIQRTRRSRLYLAESGARQEAITRPRPGNTGNCSTAAG